MFLFFVFVTLAVACEQIGETSECSKNGVCVFDQRLNDTRCVCDAPFIGSICIDTCDMIGYSAECFNHGVCAFDRRVNGARCVCDVGYAGVLCKTATSTTTVMIATSQIDTRTDSVSTTILATTTVAKNNCVDSVESNLAKICNGHGSCETLALSNDSYCRCDDKYFGIRCEEEYKSKWIAFLLDFFIGWTGAMEFYLGLPIEGVFKLLLGAFGCCGGLIAVLYMFASDGKHALGVLVCAGFVCTAFCAVSIWVTVSWIMVVADAVKDGRGEPLYNGFK